MSAAGPELAAAIGNFKKLPGVRAGQHTHRHSRSPPLLVQLALLLERVVSLSDHLLFRVFSHQQSSWVELGTSLFDESHIVLAHDAVGYLCTALHLVHFFDPKYHVIPRPILAALDRANPKIGDDVLISNLAYRVVFAQLVHRERAQV